MLNDKTIAEYVQAALALQDLHLDMARQAAVTEQFRLLTEKAQIFMQQTLPDEEPAAVYRL